MSAAFVLATVMGLGLIVIVDTVENRVSSAESAARHMSVNVMAKLPIIKGKMPLAELAAADVNSNTKSLKSAQWFHENVRTLVNTLLLSIDFEKTRSLLVTSSASGEGKSTVASHLALASASMRKKTLLIDADMRRGVVNRLFQLDQDEMGFAACSRERRNGEMPWFPFRDSRTFTCFPRVARLSLPSTSTAC